MQKKDKKIRVLVGTVVSDKMEKTRVVAVDRIKADPKYLKRFKRTARYKAHDEKNQYKTGDRVKIAATRPLSKEKKWIIIEKI